MNTTQRYDMRGGTERVSFQVAFPCDQVLIVASGGMRFWYSDQNDREQVRGRSYLQPKLIMPPRDYKAGEVCNVEGGRTYAFAASEPNTVVYHAW